MLWTISKQVQSLRARRQPIGAGWARNSEDEDSIVQWQNRSSRRYVLGIYQPPPAEIKSRDLDHSVPAPVNPSKQNYQDHALAEMRNHVRYTPGLKRR